MLYALHVPYCHYIISAFAVIISVWKISEPLAMSGTQICDLVVCGARTVGCSDWAMSRTIKDPYFVSWQGTEIYFFFKPS